MMFTSNNVWEQVGITSTGVGCALANYSGIYTRVSAYKSWIDANSANQICTISYTKLFLILLLTLL